jgi:hypothetical protein
MINLPIPFRFIVLYYLEHNDYAMPPSIYVAATHDTAELAKLECLSKHAGATITQVVDMQNPQQIPVVWKGNPQ